MSVTSRRPLVLTFALSLALPLGLAALANAESYTVTLHNGSTFRTRYQPQAAAWDANKILFRTDAGNFISVSTADVAAVVTESENRGFGRVLDGTTLILGDAPNDLPVPVVPAAPGTPEAAAQAAAAAAQAAKDQAPPAAPYSVNQFVEPGQSQGIPGGWIGSGGGGYGTPTPQPAAPVSPPQ